MSKRGAYVIFEGPEFSGKTEMSHRIADKTGALWIREPGYTPLGKKIRDRVLNPEHMTLDANTELLLTALDKALTKDRARTPAIESGKSVVSDRSWVSSIVYQCYGDGVDRKLANEILLEAVGPPEEADKYVFLDISLETAAERARNRTLEYSEPDRFERQDSEYHLRIRQGYLKLAQELGDKAVTIDASTTIEEVYERVWHEVGDLLLNGVEYE